MRRQGEHHATVIMGSGLFVETELLKLEKNGQFPDEPAKRKDTQTHSGDGQTVESISNSSHKENGVRKTITLISTVL